MFLNVFLFLSDFIHLKKENTSIPFNYYKILSLFKLASNYLSFTSKFYIKTDSVALVLCLNVGVDPPDVVKINPCARMECWIGECIFLAQHLIAF